MNDDFGFSTIRKKLTESYQPEDEVEKRPEIDRLVRHEKQIQERKANQEELIYQLQTHLDTLTTRYAKLEQQYQALTVNYDRLRKTKTASSPTHKNRASGKISRPDHSIDFTKYSANKPLSTALSAASTSF